MDPVALAALFRAVRSATDALAAPLSPEDQMLQSMDAASPTKWHLGHTSWFFETFLLERPGEARRLAGADRIFNSYYQTLGEPLPRLGRGLLSRPSSDEITAYRRAVDADVLRLLAGDAPAKTLALIELGLNHEEQHQELILTDIKHALYANPLRPAYLHDRPARDQSDRQDSTSPPLAFREFGGGVSWVGHPGSGFGFDNESPRHQVLLHDFALADRLITAREFADFIADGGYRRPELWLSDGWQLVQAEGWRAPLYWELRDGELWHFTLFGMQPCALDEPVTHVSLYEADAYSRWAGARLPTEFEWERAASGQSLQPQVESGNFLEARRFHPQVAPAVASKQSAGDETKSDRPLQQLTGDVWEWTQSAYAPYPGYRPAPGALGEYNGKFMCNQFVLRGGSCVTPARHMRVSYRNFFPPAARWQFTGIRLAKDLIPSC